MIEEEYLARKYCEPKAYWHCLQELGEPPMSLVVLNELEEASWDVQTNPKRWLDAVRLCTKRAPSPAAKQLHRRVEAARAEFKAKKDRIYGNRKVSETEGLEDIYRREDKAWDAFNAHKRDCLRAYLSAIETGKLETQRAKRRHTCHEEGCRELLSGRVKFCDICKRARNREAARVYRRRHQPCSVISFTRDISLKNRAFGLPDTSKGFLRQSRLSNLRRQDTNLPFTGDREAKAGCLPVMKPDRRSSRTFAARERTF